MATPRIPAWAWLLAGLGCFVLAFVALVVGTALGGIFMDVPSYGDYRYRKIAGIGTPAFGAAGILCVLVAVVVSLRKRDAA